MSWPIVKIEDIFDVARGGSPRPIDAFITDDPDGVNWIMIGDTKSGEKYISTTAKRIRPEGVKKSRVVKEGDFLLTNSMSFGRPYILKTSGCIHDGWLVLSPKSDNIYTDYFYYYLGSQEIKNKLAGKAAGAVVKNLNKDIVKGLEIPLPPLEEQKRIAAILDKADAIRQKRKQAIELADEFLRSVFLDMFGDPVSNPKGWDTSTLDELAIGKFQNGAYFPKDQYSTEGVEMVHMSDAFYDYVPRGSMKRVIVGDADLKKYEVNAKDLLISRRSLNYEGAAKPSLIEASDAPLLFESSLIRITPNPQLVNKLYLFSYLSNEIVKEHKIRKYVTGATIKGISQKNLEKVEVLVPPVELQEKFAQIFIKIEKIKTQLHQPLLNRDVFESLSQKAFSGQL
ncbi:restriction endonuclease subunit S [Vibrio owensii]|uniref:Restriction endonuclease subunit S n=2 Tax=Vibrio harveyi group TaxID=717610 RepID=A0ABM6ZPA8_9VIBR|nr:MULTISPECIES: restriction endonuclease subunit S [Vibrio harveyi group]HAT7741344.1 restriction endonuclease subunit S [Vibrio vulnificus]AYO17534.1 restriction endonuclease subunit S [Vibrio owensii]MCR9666548.1 restriction endonuclease subunit S [Vibrio parahaemolyticus]MCR9678699.1 restriction endonuclease subunit S [Vibrio parahaemolyticus]MDF4269657.1 restriction endonuclease subunit S [Vibrio parahaemolyticus]